MPNNAAGEDFYRGRGDDQTIWLNRRNNAQSPTGSFCCELLDDSDVTHRVCVTLGKHNVKKQLFADPLYLCIYELLIVCPVCTVVDYIYLNCNQFCFVVYT